MKIQLFLLKEIFKIKNVILLIIFINFNVFFWQFLQNQAEATFASLQLTLIFVAGVMGTNFYYKYSDDYFIKISKLNNKSKTILKTWIFIITFILLIFTAILFVAFVRLYSYLGIYSKNNWLINTGNTRWINWEYFDANNWVALSYTVVIESTIMLGYVYFINHFANDKKWMYGVLVIVLIYSYMFGDFFTLQVGRVEIDDEVLLTVKHETIGFWTKLGFIITPWEQVGIVMNRLFFETSSSQLLITNWFDYSQMDQYKVLLWTPYLTIFFLFSTPHILKAKF